MAVLNEFTRHANEKNIDNMMIVGDIYDVRYAVPVVIQNALMDWVSAQTCTVHIIPGNHDQESVQGRNALEVLGLAPHVNVYTEPTWTKHGCALPYRVNVQDLITFINENPCPKGCLNVAWLHHGVIGAKMNDHVIAGELDGIHPDALKSFDVVYAGHWHRHQEVPNSNVVYIGSPRQVHADEAGQEKGFLWMDYSGWEHVEIRVGKRHHRLRLTAGGTLDTSGIAPGDIVHATVEDEADTQRVAAALGLTGATVRLAPPEQAFREDRLGLGPGATALETARSYAVEAGGHQGLDTAELLRVLAVVTA